MTCGILGIFYTWEYCDIIQAGDNLYDLGALGLMGYFFIIGII